MDFSQKPSKPTWWNFYGRLSKLLRSNIFMNNGPTLSPQNLGACWKKISLILEQSSTEFFRGRGFESHLRQFCFSTYLLWAITNVYHTLAWQICLITIKNFQMKYLSRDFRNIRRQTFGFQNILDKIGLFLEIWV